MPTNLGEMTLTIHPAVSFDVYGEMKTIVNRISYTVYASAELDLRSETWRVWFKTSPIHTPKAMDKIYKSLKPTFLDWLDDHAQELFAGHSTAIQSRLEQANHKLDSIMEQIEARRVDLNRIQATIKQGGTPAQKDIELLMNLYDREWTFRWTN